MPKQCKNWDMCEKYESDTDTPCPICKDGVMHKRVNMEKDEIWICDTCPAVLFTYWDKSNLNILERVLENGEQFPDYRVKQSNRY